MRGEEWGGEDIRGGDRSSDERRRRAGELKRKGPGKREHGGGEAAILRYTYG